MAVTFKVYYINEFLPNEKINHGLDSNAKNVRWVSNDRFTIESKRSNMDKEYGFYSENSFFDGKTAFMIRVFNNFL